MSIIMGTAAPPTTSTISENEMKRYFSSPPTNALIVAIILGIITIVTFTQSGGAPVGGIMVIATLIPAGIYAAAILAKKPTDQEYDAWVAAQAEVLVAQALPRLNMDESEVEGTPLLVHGRIMPRSLNYTGVYKDDEVRAKKGKDGYWRFSNHQYYVMFPSSNYVGTFKTTLSALRQSSHNEQVAEYFYAHIVGVTADDEQRQFLINGVVYLYRVREFHLRVSSGNSTGITVGFEPVQNKGLPSGPQDSDFDNTLNSMRRLLRSKQHGQ